MSWLSRMEVGVERNASIVNGNSGYAYSTEKAWLGIKTP